jgi:hypothetical protein
MAKAQKNRASKQVYTSVRQLPIVGFETPFSRQLNPDNRWVKLAHQIPWDTLVNVYSQQLNNKMTGAHGINPRVVIGSIIIKHLCDLSDREVLLQIQENMYMQYFIGYSSFSDEAPFDSSLFVDFRKRLGADEINLINEKIMGIVRPTEHTDLNVDKDSEPSAESVEKEATAQCVSLGEDEPSSEEPASIPNQGTLLVDATACPQDIAYPTDLNLLNDAREKSEELIDKLYHGLSIPKPRTYRVVARKNYLKTAQKKLKSKKEIRSALRKQLNYVKRNIKTLHKLLTYHEGIPLKRTEYKYLLVIQTLYEQQKEMYDKNKHSIEHRIVSIHQPHVRPIVRGKTNAYVEFGSKIHVSIMNGITFLEDLSWEAFNEGTRLMKTVETFKSRFGCYPQQVLADKIYCNRDNRARLRELGIELRAKPLGRPSKAVDNHVRPGERNPIEGKFGQAKTAYGLNRIKARLSQTSESWIASIILVLNLINLIRRVPVPILQKILQRIQTWFKVRSINNQMILKLP